MRPDYVNAMLVGEEDGVYTFTLKMKHKAAIIEVPVEKFSKTLPHPKEGKPLR